MRTDEFGHECPETLGEYRDVCVEIGGEDSKAVRFLDRKIAAQGRDAIVVVSDSDMRAVLMPMMGIGPVVYIPRQDPERN